jgi:hypothetical protein
LEIVLKKQIAINGYIEAYSYGKNELLVITNQCVKYKELDLVTSKPIMTNTYVKYKDFVIKSFLDNKQKSYLVLRLQ